MLTDDQRARGLAKARQVNAENAERRRAEKEQKKQQYSAWVQIEKQAYQRIVTARASRDQAAERDATAAWRRVLGEMPVMTTKKRKR